MYLDHSETAQHSTTTDRSYLQTGRCKAHSVFWSASLCSIVWDAHRVLIFLITFALEMQL